MADAEVVREVSLAVDQAIRGNRRIETTVIVMLIFLSATGLVLILLAPSISDGKSRPPVASANSR